MRITVLGATGRTGQPFLEQALERGHEVVAFVRDSSRLASALRTNERVTVVEGDAYTGDGIRESLRVDSEPVDAVVSVLGQTSTGPDDLLTQAGQHILSSMDEHGVERFVTLVGAGVRQEGESVSLSGKVMGTLLKLMARSVLEDAATHVDEVTASETYWTVVRAPRLTEEAHTGDFRHGPDLSLGMGDKAARANIAHFILDCLEEDLYIHEMPKIADT